MIINKITTGFVTQQYNTETKQYESQEFVAGDEITYEDSIGEIITPPDDLSYLNFDMVQPVKEETIVTVLKDNVVQSMFKGNVEKSESRFVDLVIENDGNQSSDELSGSIDEGYWECKNGITICIGQPE